MTNCAPDRIDPDVFFTESASEQHRIAQTICGPCPARQDCRDRAIRNGEQIGVWGGLTELQLTAQVRFL